MLTRSMMRRRKSETRGVLLSLTFSNIAPNVSFKFEGEFKILNFALLFMFSHVISPIKVNCLALKFSKFVFSENVGYD